MADVGDSQITFLTEWQLYAQKVEGDAWKGQKLDPVVMEKMTGKSRAPTPLPDPICLGRGARELALLMAWYVQRSKLSSSTSCYRRYETRKRAVRRAGHRGDRLETLGLGERRRGGCTELACKGDHRLDRTITTCISILGRSQKEQCCHYIITLRSPVDETDLTSATERP